MVVRGTLYGRDIPIYIPVLHLAPGENLNSIQPVLERQKQNNTSPDSCRWKWAPRETLPLVKIGKKKKTCDISRTEPCIEVLVVAGCFWSNMSKHAQFLSFSLIRTHITLKKTSSWGRCVSQSDHQIIKIYYWYIVFWGFSFIYLLL